MLRYIYKQFYRKFVPSDRLTDQPTSYLLALQRKI